MGSSLVSSRSSEGDLIFKVTLIFEGLRSDPDKFFYFFLYACFRIWWVAFHILGRTTFKNGHTEGYFPAEKLAVPIMLR